MTNHIKQRYSCSGCFEEFTVKGNITNHLKRKIPCTLNTELKCIKTMYTSCSFCFGQVKTNTTVNFMDKHLDKCMFKDRSLNYSKINNNTINNTINNTTNNTINIINFDSDPNYIINYLKNNPELINNMINLLTIECDNSSLDNTIDK